MEKKTTITFRNVLEHLSRIAYGDHMAMLEAYQAYFKADPNPPNIKWCRVCFVPVNGPMSSCHSCLGGFCKRSFCPSSKVPVHTCPVSGQDIEFCSVECSLCSCTGCETTVCENCSSRCVCCNEYDLCSEHITRKPNARDDAGLCHFCLDMFVEIKRKN